MTSSNEVGKGRTDGHNSGSTETSSSKCFGFVVGLNHNCGDIEIPDTRVWFDKYKIYARHDYFLINEHLKFSSEYIIKIQIIEDALHIIICFFSFSLFSCKTFLDLQ